MKQKMFINVLTSCVFGFVFLNAISHLFFRFIFLTNQSEECILFFLKSSSTIFVSDSHFLYYGSSRFGDLILYCVAHTNMNNCAERV